MVCILICFGSTGVGSLSNLYSRVVNEQESIANDMTKVKQNKAMLQFLHRYSYAPYVTHNIWWNHHMRHN